MLIEMVPLLLLYELSIVLARMLGGSREPVEQVASAEGS
jgi:Sec-independent protein secretion pathway component TatC